MSEAPLPSDEALRLTAPGLAAEQGGVPRPETGQRVEARPMRWVSVGFGVALLAMLLSGANAARSLRSAQALAEQRLQVRQLLVESLSLVASLQTARNEQQSLLLTSDGRHLVAYDAAVADVGRRMQAVERLAQAPGMPAFDLQRLHAVLTEHSAAVDAVVAAYRQSGHAAALRVARAGREWAAGAAVNAQVNAQIETVQRALSVRVARGNEDISAALRWFAAGGVVSALLLLAGFAWLRHEVRRRQLAVEALAQSHQSIEREVADRTASLVAVNDALRANEAFVRSIGDNLPGGVIYQAMTDADGKLHLKYISAGVEGIHGVTAQAALERPGLLEEQVLDEDRPAWLAARAEASRSRRAFSVEVRMRRPDGEVRWCRLTSAPRLASDGQLVWDGIEIDITELKRSAAQREQVLTRVSDVVFSLDDQWRFVFVNDKAAEIVGWTREALAGKQIWTEFPDFVGSQLYAACLRAKADQHFALCVDYNVRTGRWFESRIYPAPDGVSVFARDVTDGRRSEQALHASEARLRMALEASNIGLWEWQVGSDEVYYSPLLKRQMGYEDHEIANRADTWQQHVHPEDLAATRTKLAASLHSPWPRYEHEYRLRHKDGSFRWIRAVGAMLLDDAGKPLRLLGTQLDVTEMRRAQAERERLLSQQLAARAEADAAHRRLADVLESVSDAFVALDRDWRYVFVNQRAAQIFGRKSEDLVGKHIWTEFPEGVGQPFHRAYEKAMNERVFVFLEEYYPPYDRWFENRIYPSAEGISIFFHDISERKRAEAALRTTEAQLHELLAQLQRAQEAERIRVARQIHDELGQLLTGVKMDLRWLERKLGEPGMRPQFNALLDRTVAASELNDQTIAAVQRIAAELRPMALDQLGLAAALSQAARAFQARSGVRCSLMLPDAEPALPVHTASELFYIAQEALTNVARHAQAGAVEIELHAHADEVVLEVRDDGIGIDPAKINGRHSLGLLGMRERALQCGGALEVQRIGTRGTRVTARAPLTSPAGSTLP